MSQEFAPGAERVTALIGCEMKTGEAIVGPLVVGYYPGSDELWIEQDGHRVQFPADRTRELNRQLKRAAEIQEDEQV